MTLLAPGCGLTILSIQTITKAALYSALRIHQRAAFLTWLEQHMMACAIVHLKAAECLVHQHLISNPVEVDRAVGMSQRR